MLEHIKSFNFSLVVCTYQRSESLERLMDSVAEQSLYPNEILIVDGSLEDNTKKLIQARKYRNLTYFRVKENDRGLTRQRNYGISKLASEAEIVCFLDDDIVLDKGYFENLINTYHLRPKAIAVGGMIVNETNWTKLDNKHKVTFDEFSKDGFVRKLGLRNLVRKKLNLLSDKPPGFMPSFSHGLSISFLPPTGNIYPVEFFMGGVSSYKKEIFEELSFSNYFEGYGLYEDMDFCLRASSIGEMFVNTAARVEHLHEEGGRPDYFKYGKMVVRNGFYVWKIKNPNPNFKSVLKWNAITLLLILIRLSNILNTNEKEKSLMDSLGRFIGWISLAINKPREI
ncbi:glycosyltransferase family 2 protein [Christiangramia forsetii]|uniref:Glycosyl transferase, family 2 n=2 Tax=Christiangramia forsetii TaxID=411153 RepID=A0LYW5_CHRFK|nr:glycosyltransferase family A protein [Christiangramia forsetii]GGG33186.1 glycosyl transferase family 2 [Christiangramia forsetii]CAL65560.1 glycosyl transferase, family 2 [Christiangramia forsetii KT0803]